jgi:hypothetical protein
VKDYPADLQSQRLRVSVYDRAWCWLLALLLLFGTAVFMLFMVWLSNHMHVVDIAREVDLTEVGDGEGGGDGRPSGGTQLESPENSSEQIELNDTSTPDVADTLTAVSETVVETVTQLDDPSLQTARPKGDYGTGGGSGGGSGPGRGMGHGKGRPGRPQRWDWKIEKGNSLDTYGRQLDFFKIELGVILPGDKVVYLSGFSSGIPTKREGPRALEKRYFFVLQGGDLEQADLEFFRRARVSTESGRIFKFIPRELELKMIETEKAFQNKTIAEIKKTRFQIMPEGGGYAFKVVSQMLK